MKDTHRGPSADGAERVATVVPTESDTRLSRQFLESLIQIWIRDARLIEGVPGMGTLLSHAAEAAEFGVEDTERSGLLYRRSAQSVDVDPRAFAGLRREARALSNPDAVTAWYADEFSRATTPAQRMVAGIGLSLQWMRTQGDQTRALEVLRELEGDLPRLPAELIALYRSVFEDAHLMAGAWEEALALRIQRWSELRLLGESVAAEAADAAALAIAALAECSGAEPSVVTDWYEVAFEHRSSAAAGRPLIRSAYRAADAAGAEALISEVVASQSDTTLRGRYQYELGMLRAYRLDDRAGGVTALSESMRAGLASPVAASAFLALARTSQGAVVADAFVDALGAGLDFAASGVERADLLTQMAIRFESELSMPDAAVELAREALAEAPGYPPAVRLLGAVYQRRGAWGALAELGEMELSLEDDVDERIRLHERLADLYASELHEPASAERHLRAALTNVPHLPAIRRLARVLGEQHRWEELFVHLELSADRMTSIRERVVLLERAGEVAESRLRDVDRAIGIYRKLIDALPDHSVAISTLGRLLTQAERWHDLLALNDHELQAAPPDLAGRVAVLCRSAEIALRQLGDLSVAESYFRRALDDAPDCDEALRGLGGILRAQSRWEELAEMTRRELGAAVAPRRKARCMVMLGELYATHLQDVEAAIACFRPLVDANEGTGEEALVWLDRLYQAADKPRELLSVLLKRFDLCEDARSRARLAFRIAELKEWRLSSYGSAFELYIEALADPTTARVAIAALERLWCRDEMDRSLRASAVQCVQDLAESDDDALAHQALTFVAEHVDDIEPGSSTGVWRCIAARWPYDGRAAEIAAVAALREQAFASSEIYRAPLATGPVEVIRSHWRALDVSEDRFALPVVDDAATPELVRMLSREDAGVDFPFEGAHERELFVRLGHGAVTLRDMRRIDDSETGLRLAWLASRALGDVDGVRQCGTTIASTIEPGLRAQRAWLDLASEEGVDDAERTLWIRHASELGEFQGPLRDEIYAAFGSVGDLEGLADAIEVHLREARPDAERAAALSLRRGRCLDMLGRRDDAIAALRYSAIHAPSDASVALEKARLETLVDRLDDARATLEDCLGAGVQGASRIEVLGRLADLHQMAGGTRERAIEALEDAFTLSERAREWGTRLASAHASFGDPERCASLLEAVLPTPVRDEDIRHWQLLARVYAHRLDRNGDAEDILWSLFETFPERRATLSGLEEFYRRFSGARSFADRLADALAQGRVPLSPERLGELWTYVGELYFAVLEDYRQAETAFAAAMEASGATASVALREAKAAAKQSGRGREAARKALTALELAEGDRVVWEDASVALEQMYEGLEDAARLRVARQLRRTLGASIRTGETDARRETPRGLDPALAWELLAARLLTEPERAVLCAASPLAEKVFHRMAPSRKAHRGRRLRADEFPTFDAFLQESCAWLGAAIPKVTVGDGEGTARFLESGHFWISSSCLDDAYAPNARFWAGYIACMMFHQLGPLSWTQGHEARELIAAVGVKGLGMEVAEGALFAEEVGGLLVMPMRRQAAAALREHPEALATLSTSAGHAAVMMADRAGLVMSGDLTVAVSEVLRAEGWTHDLADTRTREVVLRMPRLRDLIQFALSDAHYVLRYESGLAQRPWLFG